MPANWNPPTEQLWNEMKQALQSVSMPFQAHQLVQRILGDVERQTVIHHMRLAASQKPYPVDQKPYPVAVPDGPPMVD